MSRQSLKPVCGNTVYGNAREYWIARECWKNVRTALPRGIVSSRVASWQISTDPIIRLKNIVLFCASSASSFPWLQEDQAIDHLRFLVHRLARTCFSLLARIISSHFRYEASNTRVQSRSRRTDSLQARSATPSGLCSFFSYRSGDYYSLSR